MKTISFIILLSTIITMTPFTEKYEKLESLGANQFHFEEQSDKWLSSANGHCEIWKGKKQCAVAHLSFFYSKAELYLENDVINSGYFRYNYKKKEYESRYDLAKLVKETYLKSSTKSIYELTQSVFDRKKERLAVTLRYRPTRIPNFVERKDLPRCLFALIDTKSNTVVKVEAVNIAINLSVERTKDYMVFNINDKLQVWDIVSGKSIVIEALKDKQIDEIVTNQKTNHIVATTRKGAFFKYDIESTTMENIVPVEWDHKVFMLNQKDTYLVVTNKKNAAIYSKNKKGQYKVVKQFTTTSAISDVFYDAKTTILYVATWDRDFPIRRYLNIGRL